MVLVNFAHPITESQRQRIEELTRRPIEGIVDVRAQFDHQSSLAQQACVLVDSAGISAGDWQMAPLLVNLPSLSVIAALVLGEIRGRAGHFPAVLRLRPVSGAATQSEVAEILNLQEIRDQAKEGRDD